MPTKSKFLNKCTFSKDVLAFVNEFPDALLEVKILFLEVSILVELLSVNLSLIVLLPLNEIFFEVRTVGVIAFGTLPLPLLRDLLHSIEPVMFWKVFGVGIAPLSAFVNYKDLFLVKEKWKA